MENPQVDERENKDELAAENQAAADQEQAGQEEATVTKLREELALSKDKYLRLYSEFDNFRKRTAREKLEMIQSANEQLIKSLLPVIDDFERAEKSLAEANDQNLEGFALIHNKFRKVLELYGVKAMAIEKGSEFNIDMHEAITQLPAAEEKFKGKIIEVVENGYLLNDKVIRFAKVVVGG